MKKLWLRIGLSFFYLIFCGHGGCWILLRGIDARRVLAHEGEPIAG